MIRDVNDPLYSFSGHIHHAKNLYRPLSLLVLCIYGCQSVYVVRETSCNKSRSIIILTVLFLSKTVEFTYEFTYLLIF